MSSSPAPREYRPDIDGLRAIAVVSVVLFHAFPQRLRGGFVGVDIFFVISGFLIGGIIAAGVESRTFSFADFYARRARRIFPALALVLGATLFVGWWILLPDEYKLVARHVVGGAGFVANLLSWGDAGYFDVASARKPLLHLWSLGVEEQFYLVWPLLALAAFRARLSLSWLAAGIALLSFSWNVFEAWSDPVADFYSPLSRFWELMVGVLIASASRSPGLSRGSSDAMSLVGLALVVASFFLIADGDRFPGFWALLPVGGSALIIAAGPLAIVNLALLSRGLPVALGLVSYPLYLWHWPLLAYAHVAGADGFRARATLAVAALALSIPTYLYVERPIRFGRSAGARPLNRFARTSIAASALILIAAVGVAALYSTSRLGGILQSLLVDQRSHDAHWPHKDLTPPSGPPSVTFFVKGDPSAEKTLFLGDSHAAQYETRIERLIDEKATKRAALFSIGWGCPPIPHLRAVTRPPYCDGYADRAIAFAKSDPSVRTVVFAAEWVGSLWAPPGGHSRYYLETEDGGADYVSPGTPGFARAIDSLAEAITELRSAGKAVFVVLNVPFGGEVDPHTWVAQDMFAPRSAILRARSFDAWFFLQEDEYFRNSLGKAAAQAGATVIDPTNYLCHPDKRCEIATADGPIYWDNSHLSAQFARTHAVWVDRTMDPP